MKLILAWSSGKDSAQALDLLREAGRHEVVGLLTTLESESRRVPMHEVPVALLQAQAAATGLPLHIVPLMIDAPSSDYAQAMGAALTGLVAQGVEGVAFGDIFLEELRARRESNLSQLGLTGVFPLWKRDTTELAARFVERGFEAVTTCIDTSALPRPFLGRALDAGFFAELPDNVDPCGEYGEFHSFTHAGPIFTAPIAHTLGAASSADGRYWHCDIASSG